MASQNPKQLHFVLFPLMAPGHFIPIMDMAKLLAQHGPTVTIITTPLIAARFHHTIDRAAASGLPVRLVNLPFPSAEAGLPIGCETLENVTSPDLMSKFFVAINMLRQPFEQLFERLEPEPTCMIVDKHLPWAAETARKFRIPGIVFDGMSCFYLLCSHTLLASKVHESVSESEPFVVPNLPDTIVLTKSQLPESFNKSLLNVQEFHERVRLAESEAYGTVVNSFEELEQRYVNKIRKVKGGKIWCIGPLSLCNKDGSDKAQRGNKASIDEIECMKWLDKQEPGSVVYACLGSISRLAPTQLIELGLGLELSKRPFVWVIRGNEKAEEVYKWIEEDGFEERVKGRGLIIRGWAPQVLILDHSSVGAFLTHCGWNSTLEGVCAGVPMVTWPLFAEQFINEKLVEVVLKTGVSVGEARSVVQLFDEDKCGAVVEREAVWKAVEKVMDGGVEAEERRKRAREFGEMAKKAVEEGGSSYLNVKLLIQDVMEQVNSMRQTKDQK
ncbi:hypothetical protein Vadar_020367 [Vaccinium darrowii]|uniref:Uncharacterized protein n=1 Tax=Vaccinium darrowii TaxID=229202 RepID=A0ACB7XS29_9ERIC|nr:hypothetical protein Vadar_020367 [Vaccinium darrowii]